MIVKVKLGRKCYIGETDHVIYYVKSAMCLKGHGWRGLKGIYEYF